MSINMDKKVLNKQDYLRKVQNIGNHINLYSLRFKKDDFESEWRLTEIAKKKSIYMFILFYQFSQDFAYAFVFNSPPLISTAIRFSFTCYNLVALYQIFYCANSKKIKKELESQSTESDNWQEIKLRDNVNIESNRQLRWFISFWFSASI